MSKEQQAKYYVEADKERLLHKVKHPDWTSKENYVSIQRPHISAVELMETVTAKSFHQMSSSEPVCVCVCVFP